MMKWFFLLVIRRRLPIFPDALQSILLLWESRFFSLILRRSLNLSLCCQSGTIPYAAVRQIYLTLSIDSPGCLKMLADSRIALNVMPWFKQGAHNRVFNAMLCGTVSLTDSSVYLKEIIKDGQQAVFYELNDWDGLSERVEYLLSHVSEAEEIAVSGYQFAAAHHRWANRGEAIDHYLQNI